MRHDYRLIEYFFVKSSIVQVANCKYLFLNFSLCSLSLVFGRTPCTNCHLFHLLYCTLIYVSPFTSLSDQWVSGKVLLWR